MPTDRFADRRDAGRRLAPLLAAYAGQRPLILALPRGGVPVAFEIARALAAPLDLLLVQKLGAPGHEEYAIGAVVDATPPQILRDEPVISAVAPPPAYLDAAIARALREIERRRHAYARTGPPDVQDRLVIVVDDGVATGNTARAALRALRARTRRAVAARNPGGHTLILATPVIDRGVATQLATEADAVVSVLTPSHLGSVSQFYDDFSQTTDAEVIALLAAQT